MFELAVQKRLAAGETNGIIAEWSSLFEDADEGPGREVLFAAEGGMNLNDS